MLKDLKLDVENYLFDIEAGIKVNQYIKSANTLNSTTIKTKFEKIAPILQTVHASGKELKRGSLLLLRKSKNMNH